MFVSFYFCFLFYLHFILWIWKLKMKNILEKEPSEFWNPDKTGNPYQCSSENEIRTRGKNGKNRAREERHRVEKVNLLFFSHLIFSFPSRKFYPISLRMCFHPYKLTKIPILPFFIELFNFFSPSLSKFLCNMSSPSR